jgi:hypothetical protein
LPLVHGQKTDRNAYQKEVGVKYLVDNDAITGNTKQMVDTASTSKLEATNGGVTKEKAARFIVDDSGKMGYTGEMTKSFATEETELAAVLMNQIAESLPFGKKDSLDTLGFNFACQAMHSLEPKDGLEALLGSQLVATHSLAMEFLKRAALPDQTGTGVDANVNRATRLLRTFANLTEALRGHRNSAGQKMLVEHVHVHKGGQAIVGAVSHGGPGGARGGKKFNG